MKIIKLLPNGDPAVAPPQVWLTDSNQAGSEVRPSRDAVALQAYLIYVRQVCPQGRDVQHWLEAESRVLST